MKKLILISFFTFNHFSFANEIDCKYSWDLKTKGIYIGTTTDYLKKDNNIINVESNFKVSNLLSMFGVSSIKRTFFMDYNKNYMSRHEIINGKELEDTNWELNNKKLVKYINNKKIKDLDIINTSDFITDSTLFPYLFTLKLIPTEFKEYSSLIIDKGDPHNAKFSLTNIDNNLTLNYLTENKNGFVNLDKNFNPTYLKFSEKNDSVIAELKSSICN